MEIETPFEISVENMTPVEYQGSVYLFGGRAVADVQKVFKLSVEIDKGVKLEKSLGI